VSVFHQLDWLDRFFNFIRKKRTDDKKQLPEFSIFPQMNWLGTTLWSVFSVALQAEITSLLSHSTLNHSESAFSVQALALCQFLFGFSLALSIAAGAAVRAWTAFKGMDSPWLKCNQINVLADMKSSFQIACLKAMSVIMHVNALGIAPLWLVASVKVVEFTALQAFLGTRNGVKMRSLAIGVSFCIIGIGVAILNGVFLFEEARGLPTLAIVWLTSALSVFTSLKIRNYTERAKDHDVFDTEEHLPLLEWINFNIAGFILSLSFTTLVSPLVVVPSVDLSWAIVRISLLFTLTHAVGMLKPTSEHFGQQPPPMSWAVSNVVHFCSLLFLGAWFGNPAVRSLVAFPLFGICSFCFSFACSQYSGLIVGWSVFLCLAAIAPHATAVAFGTAPFGSIREQLSYSILSQDSDQSAKLDNSNYIEFPKFQADENYIRWTTCLDSMKGQILRTVTSAIDPRPGQHIVFVGAASHPNIGDTTIALGTELYFRESRTNVSHRFPDAASVENISKVIDDSAIVVCHGGGNFGDLWYRHHEVRMALMARFPNNRFVMLPQSIYFQDPKNIQITQLAFSKHPDTRILLRDQPSFEFCKKYLTKNVCLLCKDMAFFVGPLQVSMTPIAHLMFVHRTDKENKWKNFFIPKSLTTDQNERLFMVENDWLQFSTPSDLTPAGENPNKLHLVDLFVRRLEAGVRLLGQGKIVMSDRLHANIIAFLAGIPNIVLDSMYNKTRNVFGTFLDECDLRDRMTYFATSAEQALTVFPEFLVSTRRLHLRPFVLTATDSSTGKTFVMAQRGNSKSSVADVFAMELNSTISSIDDATWTYMSDGTVMSTKSMLALTSPLPNCRWTALHSTLRLETLSVQQQFYITPTGELMSSMCNMRVFAELAEGSLFRMDRFGRVLFGRLLDVDIVWRVKYIRE
jgi:exopolysaccharide biosynthesis predicted pyruvyltransferase EpsI